MAGSLPQSTQEHRHGQYLDTNITLFLNYSRIFLNCQLELSVYTCHLCGRISGRFKNVKIHHGIKKSM